MPPPNPASQQAGDNSLGPLWIVIALFVTAWLLWSFFQTQIISFLLMVRGAEARLLALAFPSFATLTAEMQRLPPGQVEFSQLVRISQQVGEYLRYPVIAVLMTLTLVIYFRHVQLRFKNVYSMQSLAKVESQEWPQISPVIGLPLVGQDIDQGPWAMALSPMQFARQNQLLHEERIVAKRITMGSGREAQVTAKIQREKAYRVFVSQLDTYWQGIDRLTPETKALFVIFAARIDHEKNNTTRLLQQIAASAAAGGGPNFSGISELWQKHGQNKTVHRIVQQHAYVLTVMASMLVAAREEGVLASSDFLWLKPINRRLWFMLNSVGRQSVFSGVAGPFAHWQVELAMGRRLLVPMVEEAVNGLDTAIKDILYVWDAEEV